MTTEVEEQGPIHFRINSNELHDNIHTDGSLEVGTYRVNSPKYISMQNSNVINSGKVSLPSKKLSRVATEVEALPPSYFN